ncbi:MAG: hypothetical protein AAGD43_24305 [Pseudomonadota bacterium]
MRPQQPTLESWPSLTDTIPPHMAVADNTAHPHNHNGGPPLDDLDKHVPEWGPAGIRTYFAWKRAYTNVWKTVPQSIALQRLRKAKACGLTYEEYTLFLLDTGRYLQPNDTEIITSIVARRPM